MNSVPTSVWEWLNTIRPDDRLALAIVAIIFGIVALVMITGIVSATVASIHRTRQEVALKQDLLERGMSAGEIAAVVAATRGKEPAINRHS